jgi:hypothetical protein
MAAPVSSSSEVTSPSVEAGKTALDAAFKKVLLSEAFDAIADGPYDEELYAELTNLGGLAE